MAISPVLDREQDARTLLVQFCEYFDGYLVAEPASAGMLGLRLARPFSGDASTLPLWGEYELLDVPNPVSQNWRDTYNEFNVKYTDQDSDFQDNSITFVDPANRRIVGEPLPTQLDRPWITKTALAMQSAAYAARLQGVPSVTAKDIHIRKEAAAGTEPGSFVRLTYQDYFETIIMRVTSRKVEADRSQAVQFELKADGYYNAILPYTPDVPPKPDQPVIEPQPALYQRILELPYDLVPVRDDRKHPQLAALVARSSGLDVRYRVYSSEDDATYDEDSHSRLFCTHGTLMNTLPLTHTLDDGADGILINFPSIENGLDVEASNESGRLRLRYLVFIEDEILSYRDVQIVGPSSARLVGLRRGCYDTLMAPHAAGADVAIIRRRDLHIWSSSTYEKNAQIYLKVATTTAQAMQDLGTVPTVPLTLLNRTARPLCPLNLRSNGEGVAPTYTDGTDIVLKWNTASWDRHDFWSSWDEAYTDPKLKHVLRISTADGASVVHKETLEPGVELFTYAYADFLSDFNHNPPDAFLVDLFCRERGNRSLQFLRQRVTATQQPAQNAIPRTNWMYPSLMSQVLGACDPASLVDRNFALCATHFSLALPATALQDQTGAPAGVQANFDALAAAAAVSLYPVFSSRNPEVASQANFEILNAIW